MVENKYKIKVLYNIIILTDNLLIGGQMNYTTLNEFNKDDRIEIKSSEIHDEYCLTFLELKRKENEICPICGCDHIQGYGKRQKEIKLNVSSIYKDKVYLEYSRLKCIKCGHVFSDTCSILNKKEKISKITKFKILLDLKKDLSFKYIASINNVSIQTVINIFDKYVIEDRKTLPEVLCFDEFKNLKSEDGKYAFLILDPLKSEIVDVLKDRKLQTLRSYFYNIPYEEREKVKYIVTDMYEGYRTIINLCFPNAKHIIDSFHYIRYVTNAFNNVRIRIQNTYSTTSNEYKNLKKYWKLLFKYSKDIKECKKELPFNYLSSKRESIFKIIDDTINLNDELIESYLFKESFIKATRETKYEDSYKYINGWILTVRSSEIDEFKELMSTFINWEKEIINSFIRFGDRRLHNGYIEGINNRIKVIKRISYGYKDFNRFRKRIMYVINSDIKFNN